MADPNRAHFVSVVELLAPLLDRLVFVGGATTGLFITDAAAGGVRATRDVDTIVDVTTYAQYASLSDQLRALGLTEDASEGAPLCRWRRGDLIVDVMPTDERILGFSNRWYPAAINQANTISIAGQQVRLVTAPLFIATKLEAFHGRGGGDMFRSHDLEDIATLVDGRGELIEEVAGATSDVRTYISSEIGQLLVNPDFIDALAGYLLPDAASQARRQLLEDRFRSLSRL